jgi:hypothetical protein
MVFSQSIEVRDLHGGKGVTESNSDLIPMCHRINPEVKRLIEAGMNSSEIASELGVESYHVRKTASWKAHASSRREAGQSASTNGKQQKQPRRKYGSISVPRAKADVLENLKESGARLTGELMRSPNSYQCNYFLIKREAETICALLERFLVED